MRIKSIKINPIGWMLISGSVILVGFLITKTTQCELDLSQKNKVVSMLKKKKSIDLKRYLPPGCVGISTRKGETLLYWNTKDKTTLKIYSRNGIITRYSTK